MASNPQSLQSAVSNSSMKQIGSQGIEGGEAHGNTSLGKSSSTSLKKIKNKEKLNHPGNSMHGIETSQNRNERHTDDPYTFGQGPGFQQRQFSKLHYGQERIQSGSDGQSYHHPYHHPMAPPHGNHYRGRQNGHLVGDNGERGPHTVNHRQHGRFPPPPYTSGHSARHPYHPGAQNSSSAQYYNYDGRSFSGEMPDRGHPSDMHSRHVRAHHPRPCPTDRHPNQYRHPTNNFNNGPGHGYRQPDNRNMKSSFTNVEDNTNYGSNADKPPSTSYYHQHYSNPNSFPIENQRPYSSRAIEENTHSAFSRSSNERSISNAGNFARTVSSSFEGGASHSNNLSASSSSQFPKKNNITNSNSNPAFTKDVAIHTKQYNDSQPRQDVGEQNQHNLKLSLREREANSSPNAGSDSSWFQLNKVASLDHSEFEKRNGQGIDLPLNLQGNEGNLGSLASLSSVASIQEQLPVETTASLKLKITKPHMNQSGDGISCSSSQFNETREKEESNIESRRKKSSSSDCAENKLQVDKEERNPNESSKYDVGKESNEESLRIEGSSPSCRDNSKHESNSSPTPQFKDSDSPVNLPSLDSSSLLPVPMDTKLEIIKFTDEKETQEENVRNNKESLKKRKMEQPKPKYPKVQKHVADEISEQKKAHPPLSKKGSFSTVQSGISSFSAPTSLSKNMSSDPRDSRDTGSIKGFPPILSHRPGSSCSGSITVGAPLSHERNPSTGGGLGLGSIMMTSSMPSWDIQNQDSFTSALNTVESGGSSGERMGPLTTGSISNKSGNSNAGLPLLSSFSFSNDYNMLGGTSGYAPPPPLSISSSGDSTIIEPQPKRHKGPSPYLHGPSQVSREMPQESRNQSFDSYGQNNGAGNLPSQHSHNATRRNNNTMEGRNRLHESAGSRQDIQLPYSHPPHEHSHYPQPSHQRDGGHEERTGIGGSFGGPQPPHNLNNRPPHPHYATPQSSRVSKTSPPWGGPPSSHHYPPRTSSHMPHWPVHSHSFGSSASSQHHYGRHPYPHRPNSPPRYPQRRPHPVADEFQPPPRDFMHHSKPPPAVFIVSNPNHRHLNDSSMRVGNNMKGVYNWTKDDDARLTEVMKKYRNPKDWEPIAKEHGRGKSPKECHERWIRYLKPGVRKGQWQDHEDAIVVEAVTTSSEQPFTRWSDLAQRLPGRVGKQIRDRWVNHLNPAINHLPFTREDDLLLFKGHEDLGKRWVEISTKYFNSTRSENHIKNRWYSASFKKFIANEYGPDAYIGGNSSKNKKKKDEATIDKKDRVETGKIEKVLSSNQILAGAQKE